MADARDLHDRIAGIFSGALNLDVPSVDTDLFKTGVLDSLRLVELLVDLEREFGVAIAAEDLEPGNFRSIAHIAEFISARMATKAGQAPPRVVRLITKDERDRS